MGSFRDFLELRGGHSYLKMVRRRSAMLRKENIGESTTTQEASRHCRAMVDLPDHSSLHSDMTLMSLYRRTQRGVRSGRNGSSAGVAMVSTGDSNTGLGPGSALEMIVTGRQLFEPSPGGCSSRTGMELGRWMMMATVGSVEWNCRGWLSG